AETAVRIDLTLDNVASGADLCGPNPEIRTGDRWRERGIEITRGDPLPSENALEAELANVAALTIDLADAGLDPSRAGRLTVRSDGPVELALRGLAPGGAVRVGAETRNADGDGTVVLDLVGPESEVALEP